MRQTGPRIAMNKFLFSNRRNRTRKVENLNRCRHKNFWVCRHKAGEDWRPRGFFRQQWRDFPNWVVVARKAEKFITGIGGGSIWKKKLKKESQRVENETYGQVGKSEMGEGWRVRWAKGGKLDGCGGKGSSCREGRGRRRFSLVRLVNPELPACVEKCWRERM